MRAQARAQIPLRIVRHCTSNAFPQDRSARVCGLSLCLSGTDLSLAGHCEPRLDVVSSEHTTWSTSTSRWRGHLRRTRTANIPAELLCAWWPPVVLSYASYVVRPSHQAFPSLSPTLSIKLNVMHIPSLPPLSPTRLHSLAALEGLLKLTPSPFHSSPTSRSGVMSPLTPC